MYADPSVLDDVEFLVTSSNRLDVFDAIQTAPHERHELREHTDASRVTLSRILGDLEDRHWIVRVDGRYEPTPLGEVVATELTRLFANLDAVNRLNDTLRWLPVERFDFELRDLADATVVTSTDRELTAAITHTADRVRGATRVRNVATGISSEVVDAYLAAASHDDRSLETVFHESVFDVVEGDDGLRQQVQEMLEAENITVRRFDGDAPPIMLTICDDVVLVCGRSDERSPPEGVETSNDAVRAWAESYFETLRADATRVERTAFTA